MPRAAKHVEPSNWRAQVNADAGLVMFLGTEGRVKARVHRGRVVREMEQGLLALHHERAISYLRRDWRVDVMESGNLLISAQGYHAELRVLKGGEIPRTLLEALKDVFEKRRPQGSRNEERRAAARIGGAKSVAVRLAKKAAGETTPKKPRRARKTRGRMSLEERRARRAARKATQANDAAPAAQGEA